MEKVIVLATANPSKIKEINEMMAGSGYVARAFSELIGEVEIEENGITLEENAEIKARYVSDATGLPALADDTGLEVDALGGDPGVYSARYAGPGCSSEDNRKKLLEALSSYSDPKKRTARFRTALAFIDGMVSRQFDGICEGVITTEERGTGGFGYDPIFQPGGYSETFAEMDSGEKNRISHRGRALEQFLAYLRSL
ncbi:RdgB/HAM1 family non-canonical purine NTP pyrophosphatase [Balneolaceae bacterium ANBcel3]|nr:RdgB/HAM1 family non-canonical purine NTP pyrophosphatase [Balneolaceae bacterium ANBcel3]